MATIKKSSFRKREDPKNNLVRGTSASLYNGQLLVSSGIASFDNVIGGGIPVGSLVLIIEDEFGIYANAILKYFLAEGVVCRHAIYLCSEDITSKNINKELPSPVDAEIEDENESACDRKKMTIAWRYENLKATSSTLNKTKYFGHFYDFSQKMDDKFFKNVDITHWTLGNLSGKSFEQTDYYQLLLSIQKKLNENLAFCNQTNSERNIIRIGLHQMDSPIWKYDVSDADNASYLCKFLLHLRALIRNAYATCMITIPYSQHKKDLIDKCIHFVDIAVLLQSFAGTKCDDLTYYKDYHGIFTIHKLAPINCFIAYNPPATNLAFKLKRKKFIIEEFSLPPELEDTTQEKKTNQLF